MPLPETFFSGTWLAWPLPMRPLRWRAIAASFLVFRSLAWSAPLLMPQLCATVLMLMLFVAVIPRACGPRPLGRAPDVESATPPLPSAALVGSRVLFTRTVGRQRTRCPPVGLPSRKLLPTPRSTFAGRSRCPGAPSLQGLILHLRLPLSLRCSTSPPRGLRALWILRLSRPRRIMRPLRLMVATIFPPLLRPQVTLTPKTGTAFSGRSSGVILTIRCRAPPR